MIARTIFAAAMIAVSTLAAAPASSSGLTIEAGIGGSAASFGDRLSRNEIRAMLRDRNYRHIAFVDLQGPTYELTARRCGKDYYMVVNAWSGDVVTRYVI